MDPHGGFTDSDRINAAALLIVRGSPVLPALVSGQRSLSYRELRRAVAQAAAAWHDLGVQPGEVVMLRGDHGVEHVVAFLGAIWAGAVPVPLRAAANDHGGAAAQAPVCFALDTLRGRDAEAAHAATIVWIEWQHELEGRAPLPAVACEPWAPACWTEPRSWNETGVRVLPHRFALGLRAQPGTLPLARTGSMLAVLRALRRGVTAVLHAPRPRIATEGAVA